VLFTEVATAVSHTSSLGSGLNIASEGFEIRRSCKANEGTNTIVRVQRINHRCKVNSDVFVRVSEETGVKVLSSLA
jgi:hypothetical protein